MSESLKSMCKVVGAKQVNRALKASKVDKVYIAEDAYSDNLCRNYERTRICMWN